MTLSIQITKFNARQSYPLYITTVHGYIKGATHCLCSIDHRQQLETILQLPIRAVIWRLVSKLGS